MLAFAPLDAAVGVTAPLVTTLATAVAPIVGAGAAAAAIVLFTVGVRLLIAPLTYARIRAQRRRTRLAPQIAELQRRHRDDPARLARELSAAGAGPLAGCLPTLLQLPFFLLLFRLFSAPAIGGQPNGLLAGHLFGVPLGGHLTDGFSGAAPVVYASLAAVAALLAWWMSRRIRASAAALATGAVQGTATPARTGARPAAPGGDAAALITRVLPVLPYLALPTLLVVPLAAGLYLVTTTAFTVLEQALSGPPDPGGSPGVPAG